MRHPQHSEGLVGPPCCRHSPSPPPQGVRCLPRGFGDSLGDSVPPQRFAAPSQATGTSEPNFGFSIPPAAEVVLLQGASRAPGDPSRCAGGGGFRNPGPAGSLHVALTQKEPSPRLPQGLAPRAGAWAAKEAEMSPAAPRRPCSPRAPASCLRHPLSTRIRGPAPPGERAVSLPGGRAASRAAALGAGVPDSLLSFGSEERGGLLFPILF